MICFSSFVVLIIEMELETFKITVLPLRQKMLNFSRRLVEDAADAEDVVQEAFIKLWYIREKLDAYHSVEALAMQVTKNLSLDKIKLRKPQGERYIDIGSGKPGRTTGAKGCRRVHTALDRPVAHFAANHYPDEGYRRL